MLLSEIFDRQEAIYPQIGKVLVTFNQIESDLYGLWRAILPTHESVRQCIWMAMPSLNSRLTLTRAVVAETRPEDKKEWADIEKAILKVVEARNIIAHGRIEHASPDVETGLLVTRLHLSGERMLKERRINLVELREIEQECIKAIRKIQKYHLRLSGISLE